MIFFLFVQTLTQCGKGSFHVLTHVCRSQGTAYRSWFSPSIKVGPKDGTQVVRLGCKYLPPVPSHQPSLTFVEQDVSSLPLPAHPWLDHSHQPSHQAVMNLVDFTRPHASWEQRDFRARWSGAGYRHPQSLFPQFLHEDIVRISGRYEELRYDFWNQKVLNKNNNNNKFTDLVFFIFLTLNTRPDTKVKGNLEI